MLSTTYWLTQDFLHMVWYRKGERLDTWLARVAESGLEELQSFAHGIEQDKDAIRAHVWGIIERGIIREAIKRDRPMREDIWFPHFIPESRRYDQEALGIQYQLGNHRATYEPDGSPLIGAVLYSAWGVPLGMLAFVLGLTDLFILSSFLWGGFVVFVLCFFVDSYQRRALHVFVYDNGLIYVGAKSLQPIYWQKVQIVRHDVTYDLEGGERHSFHLTCTDGMSLRLKDTIIRCWDLGKRIEKATAPSIFLIALNAYQTSGAVAFGPLTVTSQGISQRRRMLPWSEIGSIKIDERTGHIVLRRKQRERFAQTSVKVPNVEVFRMLIKHLTNGWSSPLIS